QSAGQVAQLSVAAQKPSPQTGPQPMQSFEHSDTQRKSHAVEQQNGSIPQTHPSQMQPLQPGVIVGTQPSLQGPQSARQLRQGSPPKISHASLPQVGGQGPQSSGHEVQLSPAPASQTKSPQPGGHGPQS